MRLRNEEVVFDLSLTEASSFTVQNFPSSHARIIETDSRVETRSQPSRSYLLPNLFFPIKLNLKFSCRRRTNKNISSFSSTCSSLSGVAGSGRSIPFPQEDMSGESGFGSIDPGIRGVPSHGGRYVQYNVYGNIFEVSRKYVPPIRPVGRGAYGLVCAAVDSESGEGVAIKKVVNAFDNRIDSKRTLREIKLLCHMNHENIISIKNVIRPPQKENFSDVYIVYELMDTDLHKIIRSDQALGDDHCRFFLYQLLRGLKYVHSANVLHRDLKPSNLLLNANCDLKIGDFGLARTTSETDFMTEYVVTRWYRAPELLLNCSEYTAAIDIWSVGCILGEIMSRRPLFPGRDYVHQLRLITELIGSPGDSSLGFLRSDNARRYVRQLPQYPKQQFSARFPNMSPAAVDLLERMLIFDPNRRITVDEALCHPYLAPFHDNNVEPVCPRPFSFDFEHPSFTEENIKELIYVESVRFNPDPIY